MLFYSNNCNTKVIKFFINSLISLYICAYLHFPELLICLWCFVTVFAGVPETAINKNCRFMVGEIEIRTSRDTLGVRFKIAKTFGYKKLLETQLRSCVSGFYPGHIVLTFGYIFFINH